MKRWMVLGAVALVAAVGVVAVARPQDENASVAGRLDDATLTVTADMGHGEMDVLEEGNRGGRGHRGRGGFGGFGGHHGGSPLEALADDIGLTDVQRLKLADLREQRMKAAIPIRADLELAELDLEKLLRADRPDMDAVSRLVDRIADLRGSLMKNRLTGMIEARSVLTPVQQKKLKELRHEGPDRQMPRGRGR